ncbi:MAG: dihydrolipoyl dehydrogenase family protein [Gammaproteobacteria bacterium]
MAHSYDLIVIGTGTASGAVATRCRKADWRVAVVDHRPFGGTCALRGCDPKKMLVSVTEALDRAQRLEGKGLSAEGMRIAWPDLIRFKRGWTDPIPKAKAKSYRESGIEAFYGHARFVGENAIEVEGARLEARHIVLANGAEPMKLPIEGFEHLRSSDDFLALDRLPKRIAFIGGGYIGFEFSHIAARAGAEVLMLEMAEHVLPQFDPDLVKRLIKRTQQLGVDIRSNHKVKRITQTDDGFSIEAETPEGTTRFNADLVIHSAGRVPATAELDLDAAGIAHENGKPKLNDYLQSVSNPAVYAAGDATDGIPLTPVASLESAAVAANLLEGNTTTVDYLGIPSAVFTVPALAKVGLLESEAREQGHAFEVKHDDMSGWYHSLRVNESCAAFKILIEKESGRILGAHLIGPDAAETANLFAFAVRLKLSAADLKHGSFIYPTGASDIGSML